VNADLEALRRRAFAVAYRMLGSVADAEDVVQEALLRFTRSEDGIDEPAAWITTVSTRLAIDHLRLARVRRETYVGPWLPDPLVAEVVAAPDARVELADTLSQAFLVVLEQLTPNERAAFLLRDVFDYDYPRIAAVIGHSEANSRQLVTRARRHLQANQPRFEPDGALRHELLERFLAAAEEGDTETLEQLLADGATLYGDGGGKVKTVQEPVVGAAAVAAFMAEISRRRRELGDFTIELVDVNGQPGRILWTPAGDVWDVLSIDVVDGRIQVVRIVRNPDKLGHLAGPPTYP
jgi:RNA polymerase sigma-70 factor (ECF subfamily)